MPGPRPSWPCNSSNTSFEPAARYSNSLIKLVPTEWGRRITEQITILPARSVDAILHDPPRFGNAGELYSQAFYDQLARVIRRRGRLFHYTGTPNRLTSQRNVPLEVARRLRQAGFTTQLDGDGVLAIRN